MSIVVHKNSEGQTPDFSLLAASKGSETDWRLPTESTRANPTPLNPRLLGLFGFYGISTFVSYSMTNPFLCK